MKQIKVSDQVYDKIKELSEKRGCSMADVVEEMLNIYLGGASGDKAIKEYKDRVIVLQYNSKCRVCGKELKAGSLARYILYVYEDGSKKGGVYCLECYFMSNPALAKLYVKRKELEAVIKQLNDEINRKVELLSKYEYQVKVAEIKREILQLIKDIRLNITNDQKLIELSKKLEELYNIVEKLEIPLSLQRELEREVKARANLPVKSHKSF
jgi:negative regulator of replication initiation